MGSLSPRGHRRRPAAFTLGELTVATAVVALALATGAVCASGLRGADEIAGCQSNLRTIGGAAAQYSNDHRGWIVGSPGTSGRELLNDQRALDRLALEVNGDATQGFDWAGPLAWTYLAPHSPRPDRRDERFALLNGTPIPDYTNPDFDPASVDLTRTPGALGAFADPAQIITSPPYIDRATAPDGVPGTAFQPQLAFSYTSAIGFLWWQATSGLSVRWAEAGYWGGVGMIAPSASTAPPGFDGNGGDAAVQLPYRPLVDRVGSPSTKIFLADGMRFQSASVPFADHEVEASVRYGGSFADWGAFDVQFSRAWPPGLNAAGADMTANSFRHGASPADPQGNALFFDGSVRLLPIAEARRPEHWLPRGTLLRPSDIWSDIRDQYPLDVPGTGPQHTGARVRIP